MKLAFEFKVDEVFLIGNKTILAGSLNSAAKQISNTECRVVVDGETIGTLFIEGEVLGTGHRDLWTTRSTCISSEMVKSHSVSLVLP